MDCLDNLIGIGKTCAGSVPTSGLYIQDLPGISLKIADAAINEEEISGKTLIERKIGFAQDYLVNDIRNFLKDRFNILSAIEENTIGYYKEDQSITTLEAGKLKGFRIQLRERPYLQLNLHRIGIKLNATVSTSIFVYDLHQNKLIDTIAVDAVAGDIVYLDVNKKYLTNRQKLSLFICYASADSGAYNTNTYEGTIRRCRTCAGDGNYYSYISSGYLNSALSKTDANFNASSTGNGLTIDYSVSCSIEPFVCNLSQLLAWPLLFKTGAELMVELINSRRLNSIIVIDQGTNQEMLSYFQMEYEKSMTNLCTNLRLPDDICFHCDKKIRKVSQLP